MTTSNPILDYGRLPTGKEIVDNRKCWDYIEQKRVYGIFDSTRNVWLPDNRSIDMLWQEARKLYPNASEKPGPKYDSPEIATELIKWD